MKRIKNFFSIGKSYEFEIFDLTSVLTVLNVVFILLGFWWAPMLGIANCIIFMGFNTKTKAHINAWVTQIALVVLNFYFLTL